MFHVYYLLGLYFAGLLIFYLPGSVNKGQAHSLLGYASCVPLPSVFIDIQREYIVIYLKCFTVLTELCLYILHLFARFSFIKLLVKINTVLDIIKNVTCLENVIDVIQRRSNLTEKNFEDK